MTRQMSSRYQEASRPALEERVHLLEAKVAALTDAMSVLTRGLEGGPLAEPDGRQMVDAARKAHDLVLVARATTAGGARRDAGDEGDQ